MSEEGRRLSKRYASIKQREALENLEKKWEERREEILAAKCEAIQYEAKDLEESSSSNSSVDLNTSVIKSDNLKIINEKGLSILEEEPIFNNALDSSLETNINTNMANQILWLSLNKLRKLKSKSMTQLMTLEQTHYQRVVI